jgi:hypothetical protein
MFVGLNSKFRVQQQTSTMSDSSEVVNRRNIVNKVRHSLSLDETPLVRALETLEDFQSRLHYNPEEKPQIDEPAVQPDKSSLTLSWNELPPWRQDNAYIRSGYRR